jgi:hypothetical protein
LQAGTNAFERSLRLVFLRLIGYFSSFARPDFAVALVAIFVIAGLRA